MVQYCAETINRFRIINMKLAPREAIRGNHKLRRMPEFRENVLLLSENRQSGRMGKLEPKFEQGIWLGVCPRPDEAIIGFVSGIVRAGTVKRQAIDDAWSSIKLGRF